MNLGTGTVLSPMMLLVQARAFIAGKIVYWVNLVENVVAQSV